MTVTLPEKLANSDLVAVSWIGVQPDIDPRQVATVLPRDASTWAKKGFVQAKTIGGPVDIHLPVRRPVIQVDCYATDPVHERPLWGLAHNLAMIIFQATYSSQSSRVVALPHEYPDARVLSVYPLIEPRRASLDSDSYARYSFDLQMHWVQLS